MEKLVDFFKKFFYLLYRFQWLDVGKFSKFLKYAKKKRHCSAVSLCMDSLYCFFKYNIGIIDYFLFDDLQLNNTRAQAVLTSSTGKIVIKNALGQCGKEVEIFSLSSYERAALIKYMMAKGFDLAEEFIGQHPLLNALSFTGANAVRLITKLNENNLVRLLGAALRVSCCLHVDNLAAGNIVAPLDPATGKVVGPGVFNDITKSDIEVHPETHVKTVGFQVPFWNQAVETVRQAALRHPENRSIGWDVAITRQGSELIEGNL